MIRRVVNLCISGLTPNGSLEILLLLCNLFFSLCCVCYLFMLMYVLIECILHRPKLVIPLLVNFLTGNLTMWVGTYMKGPMQIRPL